MDLVKEKIDFSDIFQCTSTGVIVTDRNGIITHINRYSEKVSNIDANKHVGRHILFALPLTGGVVHLGLAFGRVGSTSDRRGVFKKTQIPVN